MLKTSGATTPQNSILSKPVPNGQLFNHSTVQNIVSGKTPLTPFHKAGQSIFDNIGGNLNHIFKSAMTIPAGIMQNLAAIPNIIDAPLQYGDTGHMVQGIKDLADQGHFQDALDTVSNLPLDSDTMNQLKVYIATKQGEAFASSTKGLK